MLFNSLRFLIFFPLVCLAYYIIPKRGRYVFLLACSYYFYMCFRPEYALLMLASTAITYAAGLLIERVGLRIEEADRRRRTQRWVATAAVVLNLLALFFLKYFDLAADTVVRLLSLVHVSVTVPEFDVILPVGISFYTFQVIGYIVDVYRGDVPAERNFLKYALFVSFFPQLVNGPIERSKNLLPQISEDHPLDFEEVRRGLIRMLYGFFQKVILADYLTGIVDTLYGSYAACTGFQLAMASVMFSFQIYCDFAGYTNIAIGAARVMGFRLMENFDTPYFARTVAEFWRRWHISLTSWFRDYLYIPLGGSRKGKLRKSLNCMIVFLVSGLWHGANWHFVLWGGLNGAFQVIGTYTAPLRKRVNAWLHIDTEAPSHKLMQTLITFVLVDIAWIFFRVGFMEAMAILKIIFGFGSGYWFTYGGNLAAMGITPQTMNVLIISFAVLLGVDLCRYHRFDLIGWICRQGAWLRWLIYYAGIFAILVYGAYGAGYDASQFLYFQF